MHSEQKYTIQGLEEYIRQGEPQQREHGEARKVAIGLQIQKPKVQIGHGIAPKVQQLHFGRSRSIAYGVKESYCYTKRDCCRDKQVRTYGKIYNG